MKYKDKEITNHFPAENVAGMYLILEGEQDPVIVSFHEFAEIVKENQQEDSKQ